MSSQPSPTKDVRLGLRLSDRQRGMLQDASRIEGTTMSEFVLKHATIAAGQVLADRRTFQLSAKEWDAFASVLDRPERELPRLRALLQESPPEGT